MYISLFLYQFGYDIIICNKSLPRVEPAPPHNIKLIIKHVPTGVIHHVKQGSNSEALPNSDLQRLCRRLLIWLLKGVTFEANDAKFIVQLNPALFFQLLVLFNSFLCYLSQIIHLVLVVVDALWPLQHLPLERGGFRLSALLRFAELLVLFSDQARPLRVSLVAAVHHAVHGTFPWSGFVAFFLLELEIVLGGHWQMKFDLNQDGISPAIFSPAMARDHRRRLTRTAHHISFQFTS